MAYTIEITDAAEKELEEQPADIQSDFLRVTELLQEHGPAKLGMPHVRHLEGKLWEMRFRGRSGIARAIYFTAIGQTLVVVRVFTKKTQATPRREIEVALRRMSEWRS